MVDDKLTPDQETASVQATHAMREALGYAAQGRWEDALATITDVANLLHQVVDKNHVTNMLYVSPASLVALKDTIARGKADNLQIIEFEGHQMLISYAEYVVKYVEMMLRK